MKKEMTVSEGARHAAKSRWANLKGEDLKKATSAARVARAKNRIRREVLFDEMGKQAAVIRKENKERK